MQASLDGANALEHLSPVWFVPVMGWCGLAQAWLRASDLGEGLTTVLATLAGSVALGIFVAVSVLSLVRWSKYPSAVTVDIQHPVRHPFLATIPISIMLLASLGVAMFWNASESLDTGLRLVWAGFVFMACHANFVGGSLGARGAYAAAHGARLVHHGGTPFYRGLRPFTHGGGTALDLVHVGYWRFLSSVGPDANP